MAKWYTRVPVKYGYEGKAIPRPPAFYLVVVGVIAFIVLLVYFVSTII